MRVSVRSVLFARITETNLKALQGKHRGQFDVRLGSDPAFGAFFEALPAEEPTGRGGWTKRVPFEPLGGSSPVPGQVHRLRYMGAGGEPHLRHDYYFASQQPSRSYDLWAAGRAFPTEAKFAEVASDVVLVVRDEHERFHARWIRTGDVGTLPEALREEIERRGKGVFDVVATSPQRSTAAVRVLDALHRHHNVLLYGPPATGKTHLLREVRNAFADRTIVLDTDEERAPLSAEGGGAYTAWATFHQSYSYEDFIVGLRPDPLSSGGFRLEPVPGVLLELAEWARLPGQSSLLVIDEINRGNVSRIFGEFITLMEPDKRLGDDGAPTETTIAVRLPFLRPDASVSVILPDGRPTLVPAPFTMPRRVYTLATMNSVDKSVAPLDAALRRRFHVIDMAPDLDAVRAELGVSANATGVPETADTVDDLRRLAVELLRVLNQRLRMFLGPDFEFGHWYLTRLRHAADVPTAVAVLADIWRAALFPQLEEHFVGRSEQLLGVLGSAVASSTALEIDTPPTALEELGAVAAVRARRDATDAELIDLMLQVARG